MVVYNTRGEEFALSHNENNIDNFVEHLKLLCGKLVQNTSKYGGSKIIFSCKMINLKNVTRRNRESSCILHHSFCFPNDLRLRTFTEWALEKVRDAW